MIDLMVRKLIFVFLLLAAAVGAKEVSQQQVTWRTTNDGVFKSETAQFVRDANAGDPVSVTVMLKLNDEDALDELIRRQGTPGDPDHERRLSAKESAQRFAPTRAQAQAVADYLGRNGFTNIKIAPNNLLVTADGTAELAQIAFNTRIGIFRSKDSEEHGMANLQAIQVPAELNQVDQVLGLNTMIKARVN